MTSDKPFELLIVDDSQADIQLFSLALRSWAQPVNLTKIYNPEEVIGIIFEMLKNETPPDLAIVDLNMPRMNGINLVENIRQETAFELMPIILFSGSASPGDVEKAYKARVNSFIQKPLDYKGYEEVAKGIENYWCKLVQLPNRSYSNTTVP